MKKEKKSINQQFQNITITGGQGVVFGNVNSDITTEINTSPKQESVADAGDESLINIIQELIAQNKIEEALEEASRYCTRQNKQSAQHEVTLLKGQLADVQSRYRTSQIGLTELITWNTKISDALLKLSAAL
ncbi:MAG: hypothetical protein SF053_22055 [Bacteroidia bacterium]|nr:hypothetical protein [Bacteroidia bacterium]